MFKKFFPDYYYNSIASVNLDLLKEKGIKHIICDLDNTLDSHNQKTPSERALTFLEKLKNSGFCVCVISNGKQPRVEKYFAGYPLKFIAQAGKPLKKSYLRAMSEIDAVPSSTAFIGDQIFTDVLGANLVGLTTILVEPIESIENAFFYVKRPLEKFIKAKIVKE